MRATAQSLLAEAHRLETALNRVGAKDNPCTCDQFCGEYVVCKNCLGRTRSQKDLDIDRGRLRIEVLNDLLTLTDAGVELDSAALRELVAECEAATQVVGR